MIKLKQKNDITVNILLVIAGLWMVSCSSRTVGPAGRAPAGGSPVYVRVMSYNIHHSNPPAKQDVIDIDGIAKVIREEDPDLVALQEVDVNTQRSGNFNQAEELGRKLGMHYYFAKAIDYQGGAYGVAILSKFPLQETTVHRLPLDEETRGEPRIIATARAELPNGVTIRFGSTHLDAQRQPGNRELQIAEVVRVASKETLPFILAGDFNAVTGSPVMETLKKEFRLTCEDCPFTSSAQNPVRTIDHIAFRDPLGVLTVDDHHVVKKAEASDHLPVVAVFKVAPGKDEPAD